MNSNIFCLPCAVAISVYVSKLLLSTLGFLASPAVLVGAVLFCTFLLLGRNLIELALIGVLTGIACTDNLVIGISPDVLLALLVTIILLPATIHLMDLDVDMRGVSYQIPR